MEQYGVVQKVEVALCFEADPYQFRVGLACGHTTIVLCIDDEEPTEARCFTCARNEWSTRRIVTEELVKWHREFPERTSWRVWMTCGHQTMITVASGLERPGTAACLTCAAIQEENEVATRYRTFT